MMIKVAVSDCFKLKMIPSFRSVFFPEKQEIHYIGGTDILPLPLSSEEEGHAISLLGGGQDEEGKKLLIEHNLRLVAHIMKKYYTQSTDQEDLISIGTIGLIKAVNTFRPDKGIKLATYAARCIENEILMYFRGQKKLQGEVSLNEALDTGPEGDALYLGDVVGEEDTMLEELQSKEDRRLLHQLLARELTPREADVLRRRYGLDGHLPQTQRQVAAHYGISRSYVSRIEKKALHKLEEALRDRR